MTSNRPRRARVAAVALSTLLLAIAGPAIAATHTLIGVNTVRFAWSPPASGQVTGYLVYLSVNGAAPVSAGYVTSPETTVAVNAGDQIAIQVAAVAPDLSRGPRSALSDSIAILPAPAFADAGSWLLHCSTCPSVARRSIANAALVEAQASAFPQPWHVLGLAKLQHNRDQIIWHSTKTGQLALYDGQFLAPLTGLTASGPATLRGVGAADFDNDGMEELVTQRTDSTVVNAWGINAGRFEQLATLPNPSGARLAAVADFNGDGRDDLLWHDLAARTVDLWLLKADPTTGVGLNSLISRTVRVVGNLTVGATVAGSGDYDGDGYLDVLYRYADGSLAITYLSKGIPLRYLALVPQSGDASRLVVGTVDVGGTSGDEIALQESASGLLWILDPKTTGTTTRIMVVHPGNEWDVVGIGS